MKIILSEDPVKRGGDIMATAVLERLLKLLQESISLNKYDARILQTWINCLYNVGNAVLASSTNREIDLPLEEEFAKLLLLEGAKDD